MDNKSKSLTTSVPSISIKFHANAEQLEELYASDEESSSNRSVESSSAPATNNLGEPDSSPLKYFPRLVKRSTSIDVSGQSLDASPPSDPWRFFSDIKGKITKSVEDKITEIKARNQDEVSSPSKAKLLKDKESSLSDSEELSESSISKTCGIVSTTEGVEMSSDDETPSISKDKEKKVTGFRQRFRLLKHKAAAKEGTVNVKNLSKIYNINTEKVEQALPEDDVENAVDALEEDLLGEHEQPKIAVTNEEILKCVSDKFDNIEIDSDDVVNIREVTGKEIRSLAGCHGDRSSSVFAPTGFVDLRAQQPTKKYRNFFWTIIAVAIVFYAILHVYSPYLSGFVLGLVIAAISAKFYIKLYVVETPVKSTTFPIPTVLATKQILEIPAIKEYQPITKFEGWVNEFPEVYNPHTYHISKTQSVYLRLQGNLLRLSHSKSKVPKRAMWNEAEISPTFTHHRIYNLFGGKVALLPEGLAKTRLWSKKYPICITLNKDQMNFDPEILVKLESEDEKGAKRTLGDKIKAKKERSFMFRKKEYPAMSQRFSKLAEDSQEFELDSDSRASTPSPDSDVPLEDSSVPADDILIISHGTEDDINNTTPDDWSTLSQDDSPSELKLIIFGRTDREKEDWFRRFSAATHETTLTEADSISDLLSEMLKTESDYKSFMLIYTNMVKRSRKPSTEDDDEKAEIETMPKENVFWINAFMGRVLFDCMRDPSFTLRVRDRIQRKLAAIKLPYFIQELLITELFLGKTAPFITKIGEPVVDQRGLWVDIDLNYEGLIVLTLQTKINLMKLKNPHGHEKEQEEVRSAIFHSDVDDSAESSSDEEGPQEIQYASSLDLNTSTQSSSNSSKKFIKMVDRIAESKFFQAATENKFIKKAMEGVSNTELRLKVEMRGLLGTLVLNIPPPPSDRLWVGFRPTPELMLSAHPIVGERNITFLMVTGWIEKKLVLEFQKIMVIPNMEDFQIPVMNPKLPE